MSATTGSMKFASDNSDVENWQRLAEDRMRKLAELQTEYAEFQATSRDFEAELERELEAKDRLLKEASSNNARVIEERDTLRGRVVSLQAELTRLESENDRLRQADVQSKELIRQLEQKNDDLERSLRITASSLDDLEQRFSQSLEEKALLSNELSEKEALQIAVQRLKDEVRDLRQELSVRVQHEQQPSNQPRRRNTDAAASPISVSQIVPLSSSIAESSSVTVDQNSSQSRRGLGVSTRQAALDCVQQLINCVTMMESKVDQLKRRMDREPISGNNQQVGSNAVAASSPNGKLLLPNGLNGIGSSPSARNHVAQQLTLQTTVTPRRF